MQPILSTYTQYLDLLLNNSKKRIENNNNYQNFLKEIKNKNFDASPIEFFEQSDLQLSETYNIMKDLIYFLEFGDKQVACY